MFKAILHITVQWLTLRNSLSYFSRLATILGFVLQIFMEHYYARHEAKLSRYKFLSSPNYLQMMIYMNLIVSSLFVET